MILPLSARLRPAGAGLAGAALVAFLLVAPQTAGAQEAAQPATPAGPSAPATTPAEAPASSSPSTAATPATGAPAPSAPADAAAPASPNAAATPPASVPSADTAPAPSPAAASSATLPAPATPDAGAGPTAAAPSPGAAPAAAPQADVVPATTSPSPGAAPAAVAPADLAARDERLPHDLSPWGMFMAADYVVKGVMLGLAFASLVTWTIFIAKGLEITLAKARARRGVRRLREAETIGEAIGVETKRRRWRGPVALLARSAEEERRLSSGLSADGVKERVSIALSRVEAAAGRSMARGTGLLATIGSTAPFVGLFGTVWGIMNSFIGISQANTTNLAVVAPGIAEALLATAIGLVAAIPAVIVYNVFARSISGYRAILADGSAIVMQHLSRQLDRQRAAPGLPAGRLAEAAE